MGNFQNCDSWKAENTAVGIRHADHVAPSVRKRWHYFADKRRSLGRYSSFKDSGYGVFYINIPSLQTYRVELSFKKRQGDG
jgi:hypothetical protein